jgi:hypothetical protein
VTEYRAELEVGRIDMRSDDIIGIVGGALLIAGIVFGIADPKLFDHWYDWLFGPFFWITGCTALLVWAFSHLFYGVERARPKRESTSSQSIEATAPFHTITRFPEVERRSEERRRQERRTAA